MTNSPLLQHLKEYQHWRASLAKTISDYRDWLSTSAQSDAIKELRLYDLLEKLQHDKMVVAFLSEFSRGKSETINALFFSDLGQRVFPSNAGKSSLCSTEILWNSNEEPSIKLLPIETRKGDDTLTYLKTTPNAWEKFRLDVTSADIMKAMLGKLAEEKLVSKEEADACDLWDPNNLAMVEHHKRTGQVSIPAWRHAIINYPHPSLKSGLIIVDSPGLNTLGAEPELSLSIIPNAQAAVFLTSYDHGVMATDLNIWHEYIKNHTKHKFVLFNKIDLISQKQKSKQEITNEIDRHINVTAHQLGVSPERVFPISAKDALIGKIQNNSEIITQSRITEFESALGKEIIQAKYEILGRTVANECSEMIKDSRKILQGRLKSLRSQVDELKELRGKNFDESRHALARVVSERKRYEASVPTFNLANEKVTRHGKKLLKHLSVSYLDSSIADSRKAMGSSWTTIGLNQSMRNLMKQANDLAEFATNESKAIKRLADNIYDVFQSKHGFEIFEAPDLDMSKFLNNMRALEKITDDFCRDPINILTEKHFLIRKFFLSLGAQKQKIFEQARRDCESWINNVLGTLKIQMAEHKAHLDERAKNLMQVKASADSLDKQIALIEKECAVLSKEAQALDGMLLHMIVASKPAIQAAQNHPTQQDNSLQMPDLPFLNIPTITPPSLA